MISADALRMRLRRLCSLKKSGKSHVTDEVRKDYLGGGEKREWLEIALLEAIKVHGTDRKLYNRVKERFCWKGWGYLVRHIYIYIYGVLHIYIFYSMQVSLLLLVFALCLHSVGRVLDTHRGGARTNGSKGAGSARQVDDRREVEGM